MTSADRDPHPTPSSIPHVTPPRRAAHVSFWIRELPFTLVLLMLLTSVQRIFTAQTTALAIFTLLALGTFTAGVHVLSWQVCLLGLIMALGIPAIAWIENSALLVVLIAAAVFGAGAALWWHWHQGRRSEG